MLYLYNQEKPQFNNTKLGIKYKPINKTFSKATLKPFRTKRNRKNPLLGNLDKNNIYKRTIQTTGN